MKTLQLTAQPIAPEALRDFFNTFSQLMAQMNVPATVGATVLAVTNEMLVAKARAGKSRGYLKTLRTEIGTAFKGQLRRDISSVTLRDLEQWIFRRDCKLRTQRNLACSARTLFNFAERRGYVRQNHAAALELPRHENKPVEIHTPAQIKAILHSAQNEDKNLARLLAVQYFAGLRTSEAIQLEESEIGAKYIEVKAEKCKTRRRRLVTIQPALRAWLDGGGKLPMKQVWTRLSAFKKTLAERDISFPKNAARHSFCSYHYAHFGSAAQTAMQAGHSEAMLFSHYRELVTPEDAATFWSIRPML